MLAGTRGTIPLEVGSWKPLDVCECRSMLCCDVRNGFVAAVIFGGSAGDSGYNGDRDVIAVYSCVAVVVVVVTGVVIVVATPALLLPTVAVVVVDAVVVVVVVAAAVSVVCCWSSCGYRCCC